jgi:hypothetical protein
MPTTSEYKLTDAFCRNLIWRSLRITVPLLVLALVGGWYAAGAEMDLFSILPMAVVAGIIVPITIGMTLRRQRDSFRSFRIEVGHDRIVREQAGLPRIEILFSEITRVREVPAKVLTVHGKGTHEMIFAPATLERYDELRAQLAQIRPIEEQAPPRGVLKMYAACLAAIGCLLTVYRSTSVGVVLVCGTLVIAMLIWSAVSMRRSPHVDQRVKRGAWMIIPVMLSVVAKMWIIVHPR